MLKREPAWSIIAFGIIAMYIIVSNFYFFPTQIISYDVFGYYLYLPQTFIYNDLSINDHDQVIALVQQYNSSSTFYQASLLPDGTWVMKYSMGMAVLYAPFFFIAHFIAPFTGYIADGYSFPYQLSLLIGGIIYTIIGIWFLRKVLIHYFSERITVITLLLIVAATNFSVHTSMYGQNAMSHNFLFGLYAMAVWFTLRWHETYKWKWIIGLGIVSGLAILSRPTEIVILAIPAFWGIQSWKGLGEKIRIIFTHLGQVSTFGGIILGIGSLQLIYWKLHTGNFIYYSYSSNPGEGMELFSPYISEVLFSFRKGWLVYTPILFFAFAGLIVLYRKNKAVFWPVLIYTIGNLYLISCWSTWWYAQSFSQRPLVPALIIMSIPLGYFLLWLSGRKLIVQGIIASFIIFLIFLNIFQIWQFHVGIIKGDRMTKDYYCRIFLSTKVNPDDEKYLLINRAHYEINNFDNEQNYISKIVKNQSYEQDTLIDSIAPADGAKYCLLSTPDTYSQSIEIPFNQLTTKDHAWLRVRVKLFPISPVDSIKIALVLHFSHKGFAYQYRTIESPKLALKQGEWNDVKFDYLTPEVRNGQDLFRTFVWNMSNGIILVDQLSLEVFEPKDID